MGVGKYNRLGRQRCGRNSVLAGVLSRCPYCTFSPPNGGSGEGNGSPTDNSVAA